MRGWGLRKADPRGFCTRLTRRHMRGVNVYFSVLCEREEWERGLLWGAQQSELLPLGVEAQP